MWVDDRKHLASPTYWRCAPSTARFSKARCIGFEESRSRPPCLGHRAGQTRRNSRRCHAVSVAPPGPTSTCADVSTRSRDVVERFVFALAACSAPHSLVSFPACRFGGLWRLIGFAIVCERCQHTNEVMHLGAPLHLRRQKADEVTHLGASLHWAFNLRGASLHSVCTWTCKYTQVP